MPSATIKLFQFPRINATMWPVANVSPPCLKLETWLRISGVPYETAPWPSPVAPPKGKWPFIDDNGSIIGDSTFIVEHLTNSRGVDPGEGLSPRDLAAGTAFRRMLDESMYWVVMYIRYQDPAAYERYRKDQLVHFFGGDNPQGREQQDSVRKIVLDQLHKQGLGRHTPDEVSRLACIDLAAVSEFMGDKPFFLGHKPTSTDASVYAYLSSLVDVPIDSRAAQFIRSKENLMKYCARMREHFFADLGKAE